MAIEDIIEKAQQVANEEAKKKKLSITSIALMEIREELGRNQKIVEDSLEKKERSSYDIYESVVSLIEYASKLAKDEGMDQISYSHMRTAMKKLCPTYWPFC